jgi:2-phosphosulfolactate phosphatase
MQLHVAFLPSLVIRPQVCIVVDVIRASTSLVTLVERGAGRILIASSVEGARRFASGNKGLILAGEEGGLAPRGFDYGNSPVELSKAELKGKSVAFVTTNGTDAILAIQSATAVFIGCLRNGTAVCHEALAQARQHEVDLSIVCAGRAGAFGLDDAYCAGFLVARLMQGEPPPLTYAAEAALRLYRSEADSTAAFRHAAAGRNVIELGLRDDVDYCAVRDASLAVPLLGREIHLLETR